MAPARAAARPDRQSLGDERHARRERAARRGRARHARRDRARRAGPAARRRRSGSTRCTRPRRGRSGHSCVLPPAPSSDAHAQRRRGGVERCRGVDARGPRRPRAARAAGRRTRVVVRGSTSGACPAGACTGAGRAAQRRRPDMAGAPVLAVRSPARAAARGRWRRARRGAGHPGRAHHRCDAGAHRARRLGIDVDHGRRRPGRTPRALRAAGLARGPRPARGHHRRRARGRRSAVLRRLGLPDPAGRACGRGPPWRGPPDRARWPPRPHRHGRRRRDGGRRARRTRRGTRVGERAGALASAR